jgi:hypothetical protein
VNAATNPTNAVGGLFTLSLHGATLLLAPESHQLRWWIVHTRPTQWRTGVPRFGVSFLSREREETRRDRGWSAFPCRLSMNDPPTALVGFGSLTTLSRCVGRV